MPGQNGMKYTIDEGKPHQQSYVGFRSLSWKNDPDVIAVCVFDGDNDLYEVDGAERELAVRELRRMYRYWYDREPESVQLFERVRGDDKSDMIS